MDINKYYTEVLLEFKAKLKPKSKIVLACLSPDVTMLKYKKIAYYFFACILPKHVPHEIIKEF